MYHYLNFVALKLDALTINVSISSGGLFHIWNPIYQFCVLIGLQHRLHNLKKQYRSWEGV